VFSLPAGLAVDAGLFVGLGLLLVAPGTTQGQGLSPVVGGLFPGLGASMTVAALQVFMNTALEGIGSDLQLQRFAPFGLRFAFFGMAFEAVLVVLGPGRAGTQQQSRQKKYFQ